jgi:hypothetical protein
MKFLLLITTFLIFNTANANTRIYFSAGGKIYNPSTFLPGNIWTPFANVLPVLYPSIALSSNTINNFSVQISGFLYILEDKTICSEMWKYPGNNPPGTPPNCGTNGMYSWTAFNTSYITNTNTINTITNTLCSGAGCTSPSQFVAVNNTLNTPVIFSISDTAGIGMIGSQANIEGIAMILTNLSPGNLEDGHLKFIFKGQIDITCTSCTPGQFSISGGVLYLSKQTPASGFRIWDTSNNPAGAVEREEYIPINFSNARF